MTSTTPRRAAVIHGYGATPADHWFGWLADRLVAVGVPTTVPALPAPESPEPLPWQQRVAATVGVPDEGSVVVAHSLGCVTVLRHLAATLCCHGSRGSRPPSASPTRARWWWRTASAV